MPAGTVIEHAPPVALAPWLECVWTRHGGGDQPARILPDGCIDVVWSSVEGTRVVGANTTAFLAHTSRGEVLTGVRMRAGAAGPLLGVAPEALRDERVAIESVLGEDGARLEAWLEARPDPAEALRAWLCGRAAHAARPDALVTAVVARLSRTDCITGLADELGVSDRGLRRRVTRAVGFGPKRLARILRLRRALTAARAGDELARVAFESGYADQAHFSGDCRELAGVPPRALLSDGRFLQDAERPVCDRHQHEHI